MIKGKSIPPDNSDVLRRGHKLLDAMANANRLRILRLLVDEEINVGELAFRLGLSQPALSRHLTVLRASGLVSVRRHAQIALYSCRSEPVIQVLRLLETFFAQ